MSTEAQAQTPHAQAQAGAQGPGGAGADGRVRIACPQCATPLRIPTAHVEAAIRCPKCGRRFKPSEAAAAPPAPETPSGSGKAVADPKLGGKIGNFKVLSVLGRGGMGTVYEAEDVVLKRKVAVKVLLPNVAAQGQVALERFLSEARSAAQLFHPNIVMIFQVGRNAGEVFIAMELVPGGSAADYVEQHGPMSPVDATKVVIETCKALTEAHSKAIIHRDIKPDNVLLGPNWTVKVTDFGLAKNAIEGDPSTKGKALGTPGYMSPETCRGEETDARADLYALGATYFCLLTGRPPFVGPDARAVLRKHMTEPPPDPRDLRPQLPEAISRIVIKAMAPEQADRYQTAAEMQADLATLDFSDAESEPSGIQDWAALEAETQRELSNSLLLPGLADLAGGLGPDMLPPGSGKGRGGDAHRGNGNKGGGAGGAANGGAAAGGPAGGPADDPLAELSAASLRPVPSGTPAGGSSASRPAAGLNTSTKIRLPGSTVRSGSGITRPAGGTHRMGSSAGHMTAAGGGGRPAGRPGRGGKGGGMPMGLVAAAAFGALVLGIAVWALLLRQPRRDPVQKDKERPAVKETESFNNAPPPD